MGLVSSIVPCCRDRDKTEERHDLKVVEIVEAELTTDEHLETLPENPSVELQPIIQAAGHVGTLKADTNHPHFVLKPYDENEVRNYELIWSAKDPLQTIVSSYGGIHAHEEAHSYMRLGDLTYGFSSPRVMDVKLGVRTFLESESQSKKPRPDLYAKMKKRMPNLLTEEDHAAGSITKYHWMTARMALSTSTSFGFRIDGIVAADKCLMTPEEAAHVSGEEDLLKVITRVLPDVSSENGQRRLTIVENILDELVRIQDVLVNSAWFHSHEVIGASLLFVVDDSRMAIFLIDLAKTFPVPDGISIDHKSPWVQGNHEDGVLTGVEALINLWNKIRQSETSDTCVRLGF